MFKKIIEQNQAEMLADLRTLMKIPSVSLSQGGEYPYGKNVNDAFEAAVQIAERLGFEAKNLGHLVEISFGSGVEKVYIACHLDVVPAGSGWSYEPFALTEKDGKLFGRGVLDNKGAAMSVLYAMKALKDSGFSPKASVKLLLGGAEETGMDDLPRYMEKYGYPDCALTPDSVFPIVNTEAGMFSGRMHFKPQKGILSFIGGTVSNAVPDKAEAAVVIGGKEQHFSEKGKNAHASVPWQGVNAVINLARKLKESGVECALVDALTKYFSDFDGAALGLQSEGEILGKSTLNVGVVNTEKGFFTVDMRLATDGQTKRVKERLEQLAEEYGFTLEIEKLVEYTHVSPQSPFMQKLAAAFEEITGKKNEFIGSCGLTYSKALGKNGVAYGAVFDEEGEECGGLHGDDEFVTKQALVTLQNIYAQTIYKLWC